MIDTSGAEVLKVPRDRSIRRFQGGLASAVDARAAKERACGYVDKACAWIIEPQFTFAAGFADGVAVVKQGGRWGVIDASGRFVAKAQYDRVDSCSDGRLGFSLKGKWGFMDREGNVVVEPVYAHGFPYSEGYAAVAIE